MPQFGNIDASLKGALKRFGPLMTTRRIKLDVTTPPDLMAQLSPSALTDILEELISTTVQYAGAERLLVTAWERAGRVAIRVMDDVAAADPESRQRSIHSLMELLAMHRGTVDIDVQPAGEIVTIWLGGVDRGALSNPQGSSPGSAGEVVEV